MEMAVGLTPSAQGKRTVRERQREKERKRWGGGGERQRDRESESERDREKGGGRERVCVWMCVLDVMVWRLRSWRQNRAAHLNPKT